MYSGLYPNIPILVVLYYPFSFKSGGNYTLSVKLVSSTIILPFFLSFTSILKSLYTTSTLKLLTKRLYVVIYFDPCFVIST